MDIRDILGCGKKTGYDAIRTVDDEQTITRYRKILIISALALGVLAAASLVGVGLYNGWFVHAAKSIATRSLLQFTEINHFLTKIPNFLQ